MAQIAFDNSYARLPDRFFTRQSPVPVSDPALVVVNSDLAQELGIDPALLTADILAGNQLPAGAEPLAQVYAGHQFGNWAGQLGDGRAILLGEVMGAKGRRDIVLKGAGRTPYSRGGDGRAWLGPVLREYVVSEAMHALGIPTTRALAVATTGEKVQRETALPGAILTRVAASHIRVGTFQHFAAADDVDALQILLDYTLARHYPDASGPLGLLAALADQQAGLIARWMGVGFIHGVMNTDNMALSGETIDYGPCAFMDAFNPAQVFSSIDRMGRYAWQAQPDMAAWNLAQLARALLPLIGEGDEAMDAARAVLATFPARIEAAWIKTFRAKIGLQREEDGDAALITGLLNRMTTSGADFTNTFHSLSGPDAGAQITDDGAWASWEPDWRARLGREAGDVNAVMARANPVLIPRNHQVEAMIKAAVDGDFAPFHRLNSAYATPFIADSAFHDLTTPPQDHEKVRQTFCGT
ncbi:MAG TPA: YdiU family protein [Aliiroseovarius sp.]|nr:YdiU family protein [Aliiroseovarius sp.]